jgi:serine/threonine protein kinase|tara:strand:- start:277 stop:1152 length:876 start_codon:yes stop_codon:yes gene_type:complete
MAKKQELTKEDNFKNMSWDGKSEKNTKIADAITNAFVSDNPYMAILDIATAGTLGGVGGKGMIKNFLMKSSKGRKLVEKLPFLSKLTEKVVSPKNKGFDFNKVQDFNKTVQQATKNNAVVADGLVAKGAVAKGADAGNIHFKSVAERTHPVRGGKVFDDAMGEYNAMKSMHEALPNNTVKALDPVFDKAGKLTGYNMEKIKGKDMMAWIDDGNSLTKEMYDDIATKITKMNKKGVYHGDLKPNNIMIDESGTWKLIDPVGFKHSSNMTDDMIKAAKSEDNKGLELMKKWIK